MRKLFLATASVLALGLATSGVSFAAQPGNSAQAPATSTPSATMPSTTGQYGTTGQSETTSPSEQGMQATAPEHLSQAQLKQVQQKLKDQGLYKGEIDGQMGPNTKQAVEQFQQKNDLQATGRLDQQTLAALDVNLNGMNGNNGTVGEGSSTLPSNQPANAGDLNNGSNETGSTSMHTGSTGMHTGTTGMSGSQTGTSTNGGLNTPATQR